MPNDLEPTPGSSSPDPKPSTLPYRVFLAERAKIVEARQRVQQRSEQLVTAGAVGALVLSITFLDKIAPTPIRSSGRFLSTAWWLLLGSLLATLAATLVSQSAFDDHLAAFDRAYTQGEVFKMPTTRTSVARWLFAGGAGLLCLGVGALAVFAFLNVQFSE